MRPPDAGAVSDKDKETDMRNMEKASNLSDKRRFSDKRGRPALTALLVAAAFAAPTLAAASTPVTPLHNKMLYLKIVRFTDGRDRAYAYVTTPMNYNGWQTMDIGSKQLSNGEVAKMTGGLPPLDVAGIRKGLTRYRSVYEHKARMYDRCIPEWAKWNNSATIVDRMWEDRHGTNHEKVLVFTYRPRPNLIQECMSENLWGLDKRRQKLKPTFTSGSRFRDENTPVLPARVYDGFVEEQRPIVVGNMAHAATFSPGAADYTTDWGERRTSYPKYVRAYVGMFKNDMSRLDWTQALKLISQMYYGSNKFDIVEDMSCNGDGCWAPGRGLGRNAAADMKRKVIDYLKTRGTGGEYGAAVQVARVDVEQQFRQDDKASSPKRRIVFSFRLSADNAMKNEADDTRGDYLGMRIIEENGREAELQAENYGSRPNKLKISYRDGLQASDLYLNPANRAAMSAAEGGESVPFSQKQGTREQGAVLSASVVKPDGKAENITGLLRQNPPFGYFLDTVDAANEGNKGLPPVDNAEIVLDYPEGISVQEYLRNRFAAGLPCAAGGGTCNGSYTVENLMRQNNAREADVTVTGRWYALPESASANTRTLKYDGCSAVTYEQKSAVKFKLVRGVGDFNFKAGEKGARTGSLVSFKTETVEQPAATSYTFRQQHVYGENIKGLSPAEFYRNNIIVATSTRPDDDGNPSSYTFRKAARNESLTVIGQRGDASFSCEQSFEASYRKFVKDHPQYKVGGFVTAADKTCRIAYKKTAADAQVSYQDMPYSPEDQYRGNGVDFSRAGQACSEMCGNESSATGVSFKGNCSFRLRSPLAYN